MAEPAAAFGVPYDYAGVEQARQAVAGELRDEAARQGHWLGVSVSFVTDYGDAARSLTHIAHRVQANLVVVGRSAKTMHHLAGSLSHRLTYRKMHPSSWSCPDRSSARTEHQVGIEERSSLAIQERSTASEIVPAKTEESDLTREMAYRNTGRTGMAVGPPVWGEDVRRVGVSPTRDAMIVVIHV